MEQEVSNVSPRSATSLSAPSDLADAPTFVPSTTSQTSSTPTLIDPLGPASRLSIPEPIGSHSVSISAPVSKLPPSTTPMKPTWTPPPHASFPPFYTLQPNLTTRGSQLKTWTSLLLSYCAAHRQFRLTTSDPIFTNSNLRRHLAPEDVRVLFSSMKDAGRAEWVASASSSASGGPRGWLGRESASEAPQQGNEVFVFFQTADEWASMLLDFVEETGQRGAVLTIWEICEGEMARGRAWEGMPGPMVERVLAVCQKRGRCVVFGDGEGRGVKFV